jgi:hypothetical protein
LFDTKSITTLSMSWFAVITAVLGTSAMMVWCGLTTVGVRCNAHHMSGNAFCIFDVGRYTCIAAPEWDECDGFGLPHCPSCLVTVT